MLTLEISWAVNQPGMAFAVRSISTEEACLSLSLVLNEQWRIHLRRQPRQHWPAPVPVLNWPSIRPFTSIHPLIFVLAHWITLPRRSRPNYRPRSSYVSRKSRNNLRRCRPNGVLWPYWPVNPIRNKQAMVRPSASGEWRISKPRWICSCSVMHINRCGRLPYPVFCSSTTAIRRSPVNCWSKTNGTSVSSVSILIWVNAKPKRSPVNNVRW